MRKTALILLLALLLTGCAPAAPIEEIVLDVEDVISAPTPAAVPSPSALPTEAPTPLPTAAPTPTPVPLPLYKVRVSELNVRSEPSASSSDSVIGMLKYEDTVGYLGEEGEFFRVRLADGTEAYCFAEYLVPADTVLYAYVKPETAQKVDTATGALVFEDDGVTPVMVKNELVDLKLYLPDAQYEQLFNTTQNVIGEPLYGRTVFLLQRSVAKKLQKAFDLFKADGYTLKVYDAYRPLR
ncbi:MAG: SH3 domain-containing protein, partial [Clostridia bacterium]|nr:SH3 domain-containing protein [Clostridia bacterium]